MQEHPLFGKKILEYRFTLIQRIWRVLGYLIVISALLILGVALVAALAMETSALTFADFYIVIMIIVLFPLAIWFITRLMRYSKHMEAILYEFGFVNKRGETIIEIAFCDIKGIQDITWRAIQSPVDFRNVEIIMNDGKIFSFDRKTIPNHGTFFDELDSNYTEYLLNGITRENAHNKNLFFGEQLHLQNGLFAINFKDERGKWITRHIPLNDIHSISYPLYPKQHSAMFSLMDSTHKTEFATFPLDKMFNIQALRRIINLIHANNTANVSAAVTQPAAQSTGTQPGYDDDYKNQIADIHKKAGIDKLYLFDNIPSKKLKNAIAQYIPKPSEDETIVLFYDDTFWGSGKDGFILTTKRLLYKNFTDKGRTVQISDILCTPIQHNKEYNHILIETHRNEQIELHVQLPKEQFMLLLDILEKILQLLIRRTK
ncbi:MAG: hypothetical protein FWC77_03735 [Defluviitaleaceae bacterium]|nr:hypothetical protein [Defluviitaleaceae bacterium]